MEGEMSKAFTKESSDADDDDAEVPQPATPGGKNYITPEGFERLQAERRRLVEVERPEVVKVVSWAAAQGDRSENADYTYGKRRLREIDRRVRFLIKRLEAAEVVRSSGRDADQVFFGAQVRLRGREGERTVRIVGVDEVDPAHGLISWISPVAKALLKCREGDTVTVRTPAGEEKIEILEVSYP
jgi:transcription elongation factor GreB